MEKKKAKKKIEKEIFTRGKDDKCCSNGCKPGGVGGCIYGLGFVGALVYYIATATGFWNGVWGVIKALLWPAFLVYELLRHMGAN